MRILKWAISIGIIIVLQTVIVAYYVGNKLTYKFAGFGQLLQSVQDGDAITILVKVFNPTIFNMKIKDLDIKILDKRNRVVLSFLPVKAVIRSGDNDLSMTFDEGNIIELLGDYFSGSYKDYSVKVKGKLGGYLPFKFTYKLLTEETE